MASSSSTSVTAVSSIFNDTLNEFKKGLKKRDEKNFGLTTLVGLKQSIADLQDEQTRTRRQQALSRLGPFLEAMQQYEKVIEPFCNVNEMVAFVWGPLKFLLLVANAYADAFSELLDVYEQIGEILPLFMQHEELFSGDSYMVHILPLVYKDILEVHRLALQYFQKRVWQQLFHATWKTHKSRFAKHIERMKRHRQLVESQASLVQIRDFQAGREEEDRRHQIEIDYEQLRRRRDVNNWLEPTNMDNEQRSLKAIRAGYPRTGQWLMKDEVFKKWLDPKFPTLPTLLWLNGQPGAGKTVLASLVVDEALKLVPSPTISSPTVLIFYCKYQDSERNNFTSIARTFLAQLLKQDDDLLGYLYEKCCKSGEPCLTSRELIDELLKFALDSCPSAYIIIDGIDECEREERKTIVNWFRSYVEDLPSRDPAGYGPDRVHCLFVSQIDSARKDFSGLASVTVNADNNEDDIEDYSKTEIDKLRMKFKIDDDLAETIVSSISASAAGMFLFAKMSWANLHGQTSIEALEKELESIPERLDTLEKIYDRILKTIDAKPIKAERDEARVLLSWLTFAKRPMKLHEIQALKSINTEQRDVDIERRSFQVDFKDLCESLIEVSDEMVVDFVHPTVKTHLLNIFKPDIAQKELNLAMLCMSYLTLPSFEPPISKADALNGDFAFLDYSSLNWLRHLEAGLRVVDPHAPVVQECRETLDVFIERRWNNPSVTFKVSKRTLEIFDVFSENANYHQIQQAVASTRKQLRHFGDMRSGERALNLSWLVGVAREQIENAAGVGASFEEQQSMVIRYGSNLYKCPRFSCRYFVVGFPSKEEQKKHSDRHERPYRCEDEECQGYQIGFATRPQLEKHINGTHPDSQARRSQFPTPEEITQSMQRVDLEPEAPVAPVPEVVPEPESESEPEPAPVMQQRQETREAKRLRTKKEYSCEYCKKTFTKKWNWQSHLTTHEGGAQFRCDRCEQVCARQSDLTRHIRVQHSASKTFSCTGCGKSFARRDILRSHLGSKKGQRCLGTMDNDTLRSLGLPS